MSSIPVAPSRGLPQLRRFVALLTAAFLLLSSIGLFGPAAVVQAKASLQAAVIAPAGDIAPGSPVTFEVQVTATENVAVLTDVEIFDLTYNRVEQIFTFWRKVEKRKQKPPLRAAFACNYRGRVRLLAVSFGFGRIC